MISFEHQTPFGSVQYWSEYLQDCSELDRIPSGVGKIGQDSLGSRQDRSGFLQE